MINNITTEGTYLGKNVETKTQYDPSLLVRVPRSANRDNHGITTENMDGYDIWTAYECSTLDKDGMPHYGKLAFGYTAKSEYLVESKSLKLYLNSFNMTRMKSYNAIDDMENMVIADLKKLLEVDKIYYFESFDSDISDDRPLEDFQKTNDNENLMRYYSKGFTKISDYKVNSSLLLPSHDPRDLPSNYSHFQCKTYTFSGFRSNCKVTKAPDYATVKIEITPKDVGINPESLLKYLVSYRDEEHLHEECCEMIYNDIMNKIKPNCLTVICAYTRRGGINITPLRGNSVAPKYMGGYEYYFSKYQ